MGLVASAILALGSVLAAAQAQQGTPAVDPCTLVTRAEAEAVIGTLEEAPKSQTQEPVRFCEYESVADSLELWVFRRSASSGPGANTRISSR
jgi:hypothetical protein